ncbi:MAG: flagellar biosynthesis anti-sigma factor FlgM [Lysobacter sp.]
MTHKIEGGLPAARPPDAVSTSATARAGGERQAVDAVVKADSVRLTGEAEGLQALKRQLGAAPPDIDEARVSQVRAAIAEGSYRVDPQKIAARMVALDSALSQ